MLNSLSLATGGYLPKSKYPSLSIATSGYLFSKVVIDNNGVALSVVSAHNGELTLSNPTTGALSFVSAYNSDIALTDKFTGEIMIMSAYKGIVKNNKSLNR